MNILILRVSAIGDVVHNFPALFLLKHVLPKAKISWVVQKKAAALLHNHPLLEQVFVLPDKFLRPRNWRSTRNVLKQIRKTNWDAIIDFQGIEKTSILQLLIPGTRYGFDKHHARLGITCYLTHKQISPVYTHIIQKNMALVSRVLSHLCPEIYQQSPSLETLKKAFALPVPKESKQTVDTWLAQNNITRFIALAPNTTWESKIWPTEHWEKLLGQLSAAARKSNNPFAILLLGKDFGAQAQQLAAYAKQNNLPIHMVPKWDLLTTAHLLSQSKLLIAPDTGLLHLNDFLGEKTIGLFGPTLVHKHGPFLDLKNKQRSFQIPCPHRYEKTHGPDNCMASLSPEKLCETILRTM